jgi:hypothetical protein
MKVVASGEDNVLKQPTPHGPVGGLVMARQLHTEASKDLDASGVVSNPREQMEKIAELLADRACSLDEIHRQVGQLENAVDQYFSQAAREDVFREIVFNAPWLTPQSERLREQAESLKGLAAEICEQLAPGRSDQWRVELSARFEHFVETFLEHEASVRDLLRAQSEVSSDWPAF